jgi:hypothetical protein
MVNRRIDMLKIHLHSTSTVHADVPKPLTSSESTISQEASWAAGELVVCRDLLMRGEEVDWTILRPIFGVVDNLKTNGRGDALDTSRVHKKELGASASIGAPSTSSTGSPRPALQATDPSLSSQLPDYTTRDDSEGLFGPLRATLPAGQTAEWRSSCTGPLATEMKRAAGDSTLIVADNGGFSCYHGESESPDSRRWVCEARLLHGPLAGGRSETRSESCPVSPAPRHDSESCLPPCSAVMVSTPTRTPFYHDHWPGDGDEFPLAETSKQGSAPSSPRLDGDDPFHADWAFW